MKILILFASTEGQTAKIARRCLETLAELGHSVALVHARDADGLEVSSFDAALVAGSVHLGQYQAELVTAVSDHAAALGERANLFLSVSLAAAGDDPDDWKGLQDCVDRFSSETGWTPDRTEHIAGAFKFTQYDFFRYWAMRWIESRRDTTRQVGQDREYTDWEALDALLNDWTAAIQPVT
jgi:menaquinone-dependent protoporphyrinogen oxidase